MSQRVCIVIPVYKDSLSEDETFSLRRCLEVLNMYPIYIIYPDNLNISTLRAAYPILEYVKFPAHFFRGREGYNHLMMSDDLYRRFVQYEYMLVYQLDAFVFDDSLIAWCDKKYDYVGAPWLSKKKYDWYVYRKIFLPLRNWVHTMQRKPLKIDTRNRVGNGGFSLRKVQSHLQIILDHPERVSEYISQSQYSRFYEDKFWSLEAPLLSSRFLIPDWEEALSFAFDKYPSLCMKKSNGRLPFGVHGFNKPKNKRFWVPILAKYKEKST